MNWLHALGPSLLLVLGGIITWFLKSRADELRAVQESLQEQRRKIYAQILEPYIRLVADLKGQGVDIATKKILSYEYRKTAFELNLIGSDGVVRAYNAMMMHAFEAESKAKQDTRTLMLLWGDLLLEIRKDLGNKRTKLDKLDMLRGMVKDLDREIGDGPRELP